jgi:hypothetical protein
LTLSLTLTLPGCGDDGYGTRYKVTGTVTCNKQPLKGGSITFTPGDVATGRVASGLISDGEYSLTTFSPGDGARPGRYKVSVTADQVDLSKAQATARATGAAYREDLVAKAQVRRKSAIPRRYNVAGSSGLTAEVKEQTNRIDFELVD